MQGSIEASPGALQERGWAGRMLRQWPLAALFFYDVPTISPAAQNKVGGCLYFCTLIYSSFIHSHPVSVHCSHYKSYVFPHSS